MRLVYEKTGQPVQVGDPVTLRDGEFIVGGITEPHKPSSTGRVRIDTDAGEFFAEYFPGVIDAHWIEREDRP